MKAEPTQQVLQKLDELTIYNKKLIEQNSEILQQTGKVLQQNKDVAHSLLMLLDLHREHLPEIAKHTRLTSEMRRVPSSQAGPIFTRTRRQMLNQENEQPNLLHP